jgi:hypothetical protein
MQQSEVFFPTCGPAPRMNRVQVVAYPDRRNGMRSCASDSKLAQIKRLLSYSRDGEGIESLDTDVVIRLDDDDFDGQSFGLALALADKCARFAASTGSDPILCATGLITHKGKIGAVDRFPDKISLATELLPKNSVFIYPSANHSDDEAGLRYMEKNGIRLVGAEDLSELIQLWERPGRSMTSAPNWRQLPGIEFIFGILVGLGIPIAVVLAYFMVARV